MIIGVVGIGVVGKANVKGFKKLGHTVLEHDVKYNTALRDVLTAEIIFICTPEDQVNNVVQDISLYDYKGVVAIRSTTTPGTTDELIKKHNIDICFVPEFLRQNYADKDFEQCDLLAIGTNNLKIGRKVRNAFGKLPKNVDYMMPAEAEILKLYNNSYAALRVVFANIMYDIANKYDADYSVIKNAYKKTNKTSGNYLDVNKNLRGYSGACLPKDTLALSKLINDLKFDYTLIQSIHNDNLKLPKNKT